MSIYGSIQPKTLCAIPERDYYNGKVEEGHSTAMVDVAVALSWHSCIRLSVVRHDDDNYVLMTAVDILLAFKFDNSISTGES